MNDSMNTQEIWTDTLAQSICSSMTDQKLKQLLVEAGEQSVLDLNCETDLRSLCIQRAQTELRLQKTLKNQWRKLHCDVVEACQLVSIDSSSDHCERMITTFGAENILLELITDEQDDGWALADCVVDKVHNPTIQTHLREILQRLSNDACPTPGVELPTLRLVIFGGHPKDEQKLNQRLFNGSRFEVRWKPYVKSQGSPEDKFIYEAMAHADAAIVVTSMISHNVMLIARRYAKANGIKFHTIHKATDTQLQAALNELFGE